MPPKHSCHGVKKRCLFCYTSEEDEEAYGKMLRKSGIAIHYFCMLFSSGLWQRGKRDTDGILGFWLSDIRREQKRGARLYCDYCRRKGASICCADKTCQIKFHFRCGREAGGLCQFYGQFRAYCRAHRPHQTVPTGLPKCKDKSSKCSICMMAVEARVADDTLCAPCCRGSWFHRICIQRYAVTAGKYFFKCPLCNNKELFEEEMLKFGIYIPEQDAAWELEPNAYQELLDRHDSCDASKCICPQGRRHQGNTGSPWELMLCTVCGSRGTHARCCWFVQVGRESICPECANIISTLKTKKKGVKKSSKKKSSPRVADSVEEVHKQLKDQRTNLLKAKNTPHRQNTDTSSDDERPSTSGQQQLNTESEADESGASEDEKLAAVTSPSLLEDHRLINSIPVVRIERADCDTEVNVLDSSEEEEKTEDDSGDSSQPACARHIALSMLSSVRQRGQQKSGPWEVKEVIEGGQKKVLLLSVFNKQDDSGKESDVESATSTMQRQLTIQSTSATGDFQESAGDGGNIQIAKKAQKFRSRDQAHADGDLQNSSTNEEETGKGKNRFLITDAHKDVLRRMIPTRQQRQGTRPREVFQIHESSSEGEDAENLLLSESTLQQPKKSGGLQESNSYQEEEATVQSVPESATVNARQLLLDIISTSGQDSASNVFHSSFEISPSLEAINKEVNVSYNSREAVTDHSSGFDDHSFSLGTTRSKLRASILQKVRDQPQRRKKRAGLSADNEQISRPAQICEKNVSHVRSASGEAIPGNSGLQDKACTLKRGRGRPPKVKKVAGNSKKIPGTSANSKHLPRPAQLSRNNLSCARNASQDWQAPETGVNDYPRLFGKRPAQITSTHQNSADSQFGQRFEGEEESCEGDSEAIQNTVHRSVPDDVLAMHQPVPPVFAQFQVPKPRSVVPPSRRMHPPTKVPVTTTQSVPATSAGSCSGSTVPVRYLARPSGIRPQLKGPVGLQGSLRAPPDRDLYPTSSAFLHDPGQPIPPLVLADSPPTTPTSTTVTRTVPSNVPSVEQPFYIRVPTTQSFQVGVLAVQPKIADSVAQNRAGNVATTQPYSVPVMAAPSQPASSADPPPQFIPITPSSGMSFLQWIPLSQCIANASPQSVTVPAFRSSSSAWQLAAYAPSQHADVMQSSQTKSVASHLVSPVQMTTASRTSSSHVSYNSPHVYLASSPVQSAVFSAVSPPVSAGFGNLAATSARQQESSAALNIPRSTSTVVAQSGAQSWLPGQANRPPRDPSLPESQPSASSTSIFAQTVDGVSGLTQDSHTGGVDTQTSRPSNLYDHSSSATLVTSCSGHLSSTTESVRSVLSTSSGSSSQPSRRNPTLLSLLMASGLHCEIPGRKESIDTASQPLKPPCTDQNRLVLPQAATVTSTSQIMVSGALLSNRVALVPPGTTPVQSVRPSVPPSVSVQSGLASTASQRSEMGANAWASQQTGTSAWTSSTGGSALTSWQSEASASANRQTGTTGLTNQQTDVCALTSCQTGANGKQSDAGALIGQQPRTSASLEVIAGSSHTMEQVSATLERNGPVRPVMPATHTTSPAVSVADHSVCSSSQRAVSPDVVSSDGDSSLAISRGKIWLASEPMQTQLAKNDVVLLSDSDDSSDELEIIGTVPGQTGIRESQHRHSGQGAHAGSQWAQKGMSVSRNQRSSGPAEITGRLVPAPNKPPCPVHGHFRLIRHPRPSVPAKRNPDGSLSIDLTEDELGPKRACIDEKAVLTDSDLEIIE